LLKIYARESSFVESQQHASISVGSLNVLMAGSG
jgi:hypothetical protein